MLEVGGTGNEKPPCAVLVELSDTNDGAPEFLVYDEFRNMGVPCELKRGVPNL